MNKTIIITIFLALLTSCTDKATKLCEETIDDKKYCKCIVKAAKDNGVDEVEDFITVASDDEARQEYKRMLLFSGGISEKASRYLKVIGDIDNFCAMSRSMREIESDMKEQRKYIESRGKTSVPEKWRDGTLGEGI